MERGGEANQEDEEVVEPLVSRPQKRACINDPEVTGVSLASPSRSVLVASIDIIIGAVTETSSNLDISTSAEVSKTLSEATPDSPSVMMVPMSQPLQSPTTAPVPTEATARSVKASLTLPCPSDERLDYGIDSCDDLNSYTEKDFPPASDASKFSHLSADDLEDPSTTYRWGWNYHTSDLYDCLCC